MAVRRPLVLTDQGSMELLQPGDSLAGVPPGPQGPQGAQGPQGPLGPQGNQGAQGSSSGNIDGGTWNTVYGGTVSIDGGFF